MCMRVQYLAGLRIEEKHESGSDLIRFTHNDPSVETKSDPNFGSTSLKYLTISWILQVKSFRLQNRLQTLLK